MISKDKNENIKELKIKEDENIDEIKIKEDLEEKKKQKNDDDIIITASGKKITRRQRTLVLWNICISATAGGLMATSLTTALPPIMEDLNVDVNTAQWLTSGFALFLAIMTPFTSYLITRFRTRILYLLSLIFFIAGLAVCAVSKVFWVMMLGRIIQGCGVGLISSISQVIIINIYPPEKLGSAMGWYGFSFSVAPIVAPTLAGLLVDSIGWRMIFVLSIAIMMIALIHAYFVVDDVLKTIKRDFDTISLIISAFSFGGITLAIGNMGKYDFVSYQVLMILIIGLVSTVIFVIRQLHQSLPFLDVRIFRNLGFTVSTIAIFLLQLTLLGNAIIFPVYVQQIKGKSATYSGLSVLPGSLASALISPVSGKIFDKFGIKLLYFGGALCLCVSCLLMYFIKFEASIWIASAINILRCIAIASFNMPVFTWGMGSIPNNRVSDATALSNSVRSVGGALGSALFVSILTKVATTIGKDKPHPEMFGFNIVYLVMSILAFIIFVIGIFGVRVNKYENKKLNDNKNDEDSENGTIEMKEINDLKERVNNNNNNNDTNISIVIDDHSKDESMEDKSENVTIYNENSEHTLKDVDEIDIADRIKSS